MLNQLYPLKIYNESVFIFSLRSTSGDIAMQNLKSLILLTSTTRGKMYSCIVWRRLEAFKYLYIPVIWWFAAVYGARGQAVPTLRASIDSGYSAF